MANIDVNIEALLVKQVAAELIGKMSPEEKGDLLKDAIARKLVDTVDSWELKKAIELEVVRLASQYMQEPDVQGRIREKAVSRTNELVDGLLETFGKSMEDWAKSEWRRFLKTKED